MGTPHRGASAAIAGGIQARFYQVFRLNSFPDIVDATTYDSDELCDMHQRFEAISQDMRTINFYETIESSKLGGLFHDYVSITRLHNDSRIDVLCQVVKEASATFHRPNVQNLGLHTEHTGLNKFWKRDSNYKGVSGKLIDLMEAAAQGT